MESERVQVQFINFTPPEIKAAMDIWFESSKHKPRNVMEQEWNELFGMQEYETFEQYLHTSFVFIRLTLLQRYTETSHRFSREALKKLIPEYPAASDLSYDRQGIIDGLVDSSKTWHQILQDICKKNKN